MKSYVTILVCPICGEETGELAMDTRLRDSFEKFTIDPNRVCDACRDKYLKNAVMLINPNTGSFAIVREEWFKEAFTTEIPENRIAFAEEEIVQRLLKIYQQDRESSKEGSDE